MKIEYTVTCEERGISKGGSIEIEDYFRTRHIAQLMEKVIDQAILESKCECNKILSITTACLHCRRVD
jgi:hypothetical protein